MRLYVANTDRGWYDFLARRPDLDEVNFWRPSGKQGFSYLSFGDALIFKLKKRFGHAVVGFGLFVVFRRLPVVEAWEVFGPANGAASLPEMWARVAKYAFGTEREPLRRHHPVGCILLAAPVFFPEPMWVEGPADWSDNTVTGKGYDPAVGEGRRIWQACLDRAATLGQGALLDAPAVTGEPDGAGPLFAVDTSGRYGLERTVRPRLGQGTFRFALEAAYGQCAVTREHSLPALEAAHIVPYAEGGPHELPNGLLLRADVHKLYDRGYVTVTPDLEFRVSGRLREDFHNGRSYYGLDGQRIWTPEEPWARPDRARLEAHATGRFLGL